MKDDDLYFLQILRSQKVGPKTFYDLKERFQHDPKLILRFLVQKNILIPHLDDIKKEVENLYSIDGYFLSIEDEYYPPLLKKIDDAPPFLSVVGCKNIFKKHALGIVGARNASFQGKLFIEKLATQLGNFEYGVVSGLARGIDGAAHQGSLDTGTIAVLAGGIDQIYPIEHRKLYKDLQEKGAIISEMPFGTMPASYLFARRNRIIAGISTALILCEASLNSGSMITAEYALSQGKDIFVVPGHPSDYRSEGGNKLLQDGAYLLHKVDDILSFLGQVYIKEVREEDFLAHPSKPDLPNLCNLEKEILNMLSTQPLSVDHIMTNLEIRATSAELMSTLTKMEFMGLVIFHANQTISRI
jgi:DNA processing protein